MPRRDELGVQGLGEGEHPCLRGAVDGSPGHRDPAGQRGDVDDRRPRAHPLGRGAAADHHALEVDVDLPELALERHRRRARPITMKPALLTRASSRPCSRTHLVEERGEGRPGGHVERAAPDRRRPRPTASRARGRGHRPRRLPRRGQRRGGRRADAAGAAGDATTRPLSGLVSCSVEVIRLLPRPQPWRRRSGPGGPWGRGDEGRRCGDGYGVATAGCVAIVCDSV